MGEVARRRGGLMFGKLFASLYQGTLRGQAHEILVFTNLIAHADRDGCVDKHPRAVAEEVGLSIDEVRAAIANLESPDPESRTPDEGGRRLIRIDEHRSWGWRIVNYIKYRTIRSEEERREQNRLAQHAYRKRRKTSSAKVSQESAKVSLASSKSANAEAEVEAEVEKDQTSETSSPQSHVAPARVVVQKIPRKPVTEQQGLIGSLARAWQRRHPDLGVPTWGREVIGVHKLAKTNGDDEIIQAFEAYLLDDWQGNDGHGLKGFIARFDTWRYRTRAAGDPIQQFSPKMRPTMRAIQRVVAEHEAEES